ncbi:cytochrome P450 [Nocardia sp. NPDC051750]|uniref:cytochrome P450 n=1 Tax=Nocardia sp. NPDC051750 TaxID=3364325 RepID=UPI0037877E55
MTTDHTTTLPPAPHDLDGPRIPLYTAEFAADPQGAFTDMRRRYGSLAPVELSPGVPATLVLSYHTALRIFNDPQRFPTDPRIWEKDIPAECPVKPMAKYRPNVIRTTGAEHDRYRRAVVDALAGIDLFRLHNTVEQVAAPLINAFCADGHCEVISQYALPVVFTTMNEIVGCSPELGQRVAAGLAAMFDTVGAAEGEAAFAEALAELIAQKHATPGDDVTTRLLQHEVALTDEEAAQQLVPIYGAGVEPAQNLITNALLLMLVDERFAAGLLGGSLNTRDALDEVLFNDPPMSNFCMTYPRQPILVDNVWLPAHQPVLISLGAANTDPAIRGGAAITHNRAHLAYGGGPHACPARQVAEIIAQDALDQLLDALPEMELALPAAGLQWRPGGFHRALVQLPVTFPKSPPIAIDPSDFP